MGVVYVPEASQPKVGAYVNPRNYDDHCHAHLPPQA